MSDLETQLRSISNPWDEPSSRVAIPSRHFRIFQGHPGSAYNHHGHIAYYFGRLYATWSTGLVNEDRAGQHVLMSISEDLGRSWSTPRPLLGPQPGRYENAVLTNNGIHRYGDRLIAFVGYYDITEYSRLMYFAAGGNTVIRWATEPFYDSVRTLILTSDDEGATWHLRDEQVPDSVMNLCPTALPDGRLLYPGNARYWYTDDPAGLDGWRPTGIEGLPEGYVECPANFDALGDLGLYEAVPCEASWYRLPDGTLHMMHRTPKGLLAAAASRDNGESWTKPFLTSYPNSGNRVHFGNLPDGRPFGLTTPEPKSLRRPLVLAVSDDGLQFNTNYVLGDDEAFMARLPGMHKYGRYSYPYLCIGEGYGFALYAVNKEDIWVARFRTADLA